MTHQSTVRTVFYKIALIGLISLGITNVQASDLLNEVNPRAGFSSVSKAYSDMDARYVRQGTPRTVDQVRNVAIGQSRSDLQAKLGRPAIRNNDGSYEFHIALPLTRNDKLVCQYKVFFDGDGKVKRGVWRRPQCADLIAGKRN